MPPFGDPRFVSDLNVLVVGLTGAPGLGKTTLCRLAARELNRRTVTSIVFDPFLSVDQSLTTVLVDFGVIRAMMSPAPQTSAINLRPRPAV